MHPKSPQYFKDFTIEYSPRPDGANWIGKHNFGEGDWLRANTLSGLKAFINRKFYGK